MKKPLAYLAGRYLLTTTDVSNLLHDLCDILRSQRTNPGVDDRDKARSYTAENVLRDLAEGGE